MNGSSDSQPAEGAPLSAPEAPLSAPEGTSATGGTSSVPPSLPPVEQGTVGGGRPLVPAKGFPVRWAVAGIGTIGVIGAIVAAWLFFFQPRVETVAAAWLPADAIAYAEVSADLPAGQRDLVLALLKRFPGFEDQSRLGEKLDETLQRLLAQADLDYRTQVKPWLGNEVALGSRVPAIGEQIEPPVVVLVASTDDAAAGAFVETVAQRAAQARASVTSESYRGITVKTITLPSGDGPRSRQALAVVDGRLLAGDAELVRAVIDVRRGDAPSLAGRNVFREAIASLPSERVGAFWLDAEGLAADLRRGLQTLGPQLGLVTFAPGSAVIGSIRAEEDGVALEMRGRGSIVGAALFSPPAGVGTPRAGRLAASAPAQAAVFVDLHDVGASIGVALQAARLSDPSAGATIDQFDRTLAVLGTSADELAGAVGDAALVVTVGGQPRFAVVLEMKDQALAERLVSQLDALLGFSGLGRVTTRDYQGIAVHRIETTSVTLPGADAAPTYALAGDALIVGLDEDIVVSIIDARRGGSTLSADADYVAVSSRAGTENNGSLYMDLEELVGMLGRTGLGAEERAFLAPLRAVGVAVRAPGEQEWLGTSRFFVLIR